MCMCTLVLRENPNKYFPYRLWGLRLGFRVEAKIRLGSELGLGNGDTECIMSISVLPRIEGQNCVCVWCRTLSLGNV